MLEADEELDLEDVAAWCKRQRWFSTGPWDTNFIERKFLPQVLNIYKTERARELKEEERRAKERAHWEELSRQSREAMERAAEHARLMRDMRAWGRENGYFVGTRGRIPQAVVKAYKEAKGL
ncbi:histone-like nucleoid-structuring protein Lsr2 [Streptomyces sp. NPDC091280]|uniref:Lsr2 family DNA-binding protein n=1 Tax=Streptomyces sp. NPDC091280 TaxID=3365984 RepID=UPI003806E790